MLTTLAEKTDDHKRSDPGRVIERLEVVHQHGPFVLAADHIYVVGSRPRT